MNPFDDVIDYLTYMKEVGIYTLTLEEKTLDLLSAMVASGNSIPKQPAPIKQVSPASTNFYTPTADVSQTPSTPQNSSYSSKSKELLIVGETEPFEIKHYGDLFLKMIAAMGYSPSEIILTNICGKTRSNLPPTLEEMKTALPAFRKKVTEAAPKAILLLGTTAALGVLGSRDLASIRGRWFKFEGIPLIPTFHPAYLIKYPSAKKLAWLDMQRLMAFLGKKPSPGGNR